jgi:hypothetical protein
MTTSYWKRYACCLAAAFAMIVLLTLPASAQQTLGAINGTVLDPSGAAVPDATVIVTDSQIDVTRTVKSQANGFFQIFNLPIGTYQVSVSHDGFDTTTQKGIGIQEARASTLNIALKIGNKAETVEVSANPLLNATDATNGYTLDSVQIEATPLATGSFTQLAVLSPGVNAELLSGLDSNSGLGNQPIWANGQRDTSNTFQVNGVDVTNLFNGKSSSGSTSQRYNFNIGAGSTSSTSAAGGVTTGGANPVGTSVYGSNGNSLPSPVPEFTQEIRVNTSMYDAQQGATSGAQIDVNTADGTNQWHGKMFGSFANNSLNASPYFFNQSYLLAQQGVGAFPESLVNPELHRWTTGATAGGPLLKNKLFFFIGYQHRYNSDQSTGISQFTVPNGLTDDRSTAGLTAAATAWNGGTAFTGTVSPIASALLNATLPNGQFLIPSSQAPGQAYQYGVPNVTLIGTSTLLADQATASLDYDVNPVDRLSLKVYYQNDPVQKPYGYSQTGGFPVTQNNSSEVGALGNTISIGSHLNWEQRLGYARMRSYGHYNQTLVNPAGDPAFGVGTGSTGYAAGLSGLLLQSFASSQTDSPALKLGPYSSFANMGYAQNRLNPSTNVIYVLGKHTFVAGGGYSYTQLNIDNNRNGLAQTKVKNFQTFLEGQASSSNVLESIDANGKNTADRYYRSNEFSGYLQDKWQVLPNLSITAGVRYDYHGGLTEKYGNIFNFDPSRYDVTGDTQGNGNFSVVDAGFVVAHNNSANTDTGDFSSSDSTLSGRQWGVSPRVGFAWSPKQNHGKVVFRGGAGIYYDRGELFSYLSQPAGSGNGGPFGVTESAPLASYVVGNGKTLANPLGTALTSSTYIAPSANPSTIKPQLQSLLNTLTGTATGSDASFGLNCGAVDNQEGYTDCPDTLNFGAYNSKNVLPYTINYSFNMQWQPSNDVALTIGYTGNRGRHGVIPIPLNEPQIATPNKHAQIGGKEPHDSGEQYTYGFQVLNQNSFNGYDYNSIAKEQWNTEDGGNTDLRVPYIGYSPNAALFSTVGNSAYDALETHIEKRFSHHFQLGASYTWSHTLDEQSDIGLFFTGNDPTNLRSSYASSDFDRTNVFSANFQIEAPNLAKPHSAFSYIANDWHLTGLGILQSGEPYSLYEFYGAVGSTRFGDYPTLLNPVLPVKDPANVKRNLTGNSGKVRGAGGSYMPYIDPNQIDINYVTPEPSEANGVPYSTGNDPQDLYETNFAPSNQRNIFRQAAQKRLDLSVRKSFRPTERLSIQYEFNVFNVTNTTSLDVPQDQAQIRQNSACSVSATEEGNNCEPGKYYYVNYGQIVTSNNPVDQQTTKANLDQIPYTTGSGKGTSIPTLIPLNTRTCVAAYSVSANGCPNNAANFGSVTGTIGGSRVITMGAHFNF